MSRALRIAADHGRRLDARRLNARRLQSAGSNIDLFDDTGMDDCIVLEYVFFGTYKAIYSGEGIPEYSANGHHNRGGFELGLYLDLVLSANICLSGLRKSSLLDPQIVLSLEIFQAYLGFSERVSPLKFYSAVSLSPSLAVGWGVGIRRLQGSCNDGKPDHRNCRLDILLPKICWAGPIPFLAASLGQLLPLAYLLFYLFPGEPASSCLSCSGCSWALLIRRRLQG